MLSVIIPTCNRPSDLRACLERLAPSHQNISDQLYEVIVTDDGRQNPARNACGHDFPWVNFVDGPAKGPAANRNHGAGFARYPWIIFIDDDCLPDSTLLQHYYEKARNHVETDFVAYIGSTIQAEAPPSVLWEAPHNPTGELGISANFGIPRHTFHANGGFDERFPSAAVEDTEFFARLYLRGGQAYPLPDARVIHPLRRLPSPKSMARKWEGRVIWAIDQGAPPLTVCWRLPWHVLRVIQSRFRGRTVCYENFKAALQFSLEWMLVLLMTPAWVHKWMGKPRSEFWASQSSPPRYGF